MLLTLLANRPSCCFPAKLPQTHTHTHTTLSPLRADPLPYSRPMQSLHIIKVICLNLGEYLLHPDRLGLIDIYPCDLLGIVREKGPAVMLNNFSLIITLSQLSRQLFEDQPDCDRRGGEGRRGGAQGRHKAS